MLYVCGADIERCMDCVEGCDTAESHFLCPYACFNSFRSSAVCTDALSHTLVQIQHPSKINLRLLHGILTNESFSTQASCEEIFLCDVVTRMQLKQVQFKNFELQTLANFNCCKFMLPELPAH